MNEAELEDVMSIESVFTASYTLEKYRSGPLGNILDQFCNWLLEGGYSTSCIRLIFSHVAHLNNHLKHNNHDSNMRVSATDINAFFKAYPRVARNRRSFDTHVRRVQWSINRFVQYLEQQGRYDSQVQQPVFAAVMADYLQWMQDYRNVTVGTIEVRRHSIRQFLYSLGVSYSSWLN